MSSRRVLTHVSLACLYSRTQTSQKTRTGFRKKIDQKNQLRRALETAEFDEREGIQTKLHHFEVSVVKVTLARSSMASQWSMRRLTGIDILAVCCSIVAVQEQDAGRMLAAQYQYAGSIMAAQYQYASSIIAVCWQHAACQPLASRMPAACQPAACQPHASRMPASCQPHASRMPATCQPHASATIAAVCEQLASSMARR